MVPLHTTKSDDLFLKNKTNKRQAEVSGGRTERAVLRLVGGPHHRQAGTDPAAAGETCGRVSLRHGLQGLQGGQGEVVHLVSDAGLGAGAVLRASALEGDGGEEGRHVTFENFTSRSFSQISSEEKMKTLHVNLSSACCCYTFRTAC